MLLKKLHLLVFFFIVCTFSYFLFMTEKHGKCSKRWFRPVKGVLSTYLLVEIHTICQKKKHKRRICRDWNLKIISSVGFEFFKFSKKIFYWNWNFRESTFWKAFFRAVVPSHSHLDQNCCPNSHLVLPKNIIYC